MVGYPDENGLLFLAGKGPEGAARPRGARGGTPPRSLTGRPDEKSLPKRGKRNEVTEWVWETLLPVIRWSGIPDENGRLLQGRVWRAQPDTGELEGVRHLGH